MSDLEQHDFSNNNNNNQDAGDSAAPATLSPTTGEEATSAGDEVVKSNSEQPKEEKSEDAKNRINIRVSDGNGEVYFKVKRSTPMKKIIEAFCKKQSRDESSLRFLFDGTRIDPKHTPDDLDMEDNDLIEAHRSQQGGCA
ncbi:SMT3 [Candida margitis]|uniref:SMT3 n=1 Tax=Candida margitis TaxID=1775924 RepID=UPI0022278852|nr:SMT3 [Candida margitis]KAI5969971.1 SMT3 [Candida margitis]